METINHRDYADKAERSYDAVQDLVRLAQNPEIKDLGLDIAAAEKEAEADLRRAHLLMKLKDLTGFDLDVYPQAEMPGAAGFVKTNGESTIYIADSVLDTPAFADHVAKHEAYHLKTMLVLPVETDFTADHFNTLNHYVPKPFEQNEFYLEGFNEWFTCQNDEQGAEVTAYPFNVTAAKQLESLVYSATGESLIKAFSTGNYQTFASILKTTTDRLMLHEALKAGEYPPENQDALKRTCLACETLVASPEKAAVMVEAWNARLEAEALKKMVMQDDFSAIKTRIQSQKALEKAGVA